MTLSNSKSTCASSCASYRPDTIIIEVNGALVLKGEAKFKVKDISTASQEITANFHSSAYKVFPSGQTRVLGIASAAIMLSRILVKGTQDPFPPLPSRQIGVESDECGSFRTYSRQ